MNRIGVGFPQTLTRNAIPFDDSVFTKRNLPNNIQTDTNTVYAVELVAGTGLVNPANYPINNIKYPDWFAVLAIDQRRVNCVRFTPHFQANSDGWFGPDLVKIYNLPRGGTCGGVDWVRATAGLNVGDPVLIGVNLGTPATVFDDVLGFYIGAKPYSKQYVASGATSTNTQAIDATSIVVKTVEPMSTLVFGFYSRFGVPRNMPPGTPEFFCSASAWWENGITGVIVT